MKQKIAEAVKTPISYQTVMLIRHANSQNQQRGSKETKKGVKGPEVKKGAKRQTAPGAITRPL